MNEPGELPDLGTLHVLVLDDSEEDVKLIERTLRAGDLVFVCNRVDTRLDFEQALARGGMDVILVDYRLPGFDGLTALRLAKRSRPEVPVIIVTGSLTDELAVEFLQEGAFDYILKDRRSRLAIAIRRAVQDAREGYERRAAEDRYLALFRHASDAVATLDCAEGRILDANPAFEKLAGRGRDELLGRAFWELVAGEDDRRALREKVEASCRTPGLFAASLFLTWPGDPPLHVDLVGTVTVAGARREAQVVCRATR